MSVLLIVAHPDDEVLGAGGAAATLTRRGVVARACILSGGAAARRHRPECSQLRKDAERASELLGLAPPIFGEFPNIQLNTVPHLELVQFIEHSIEANGARVIVTHHPRDLNDDHGQTARACLAASRLYQRKAGIPALQAMYFMETLSSTDWAFPSGLPAFSPTTFVPLTESDVEAKVAALEAYGDVVRPLPHPRNRETIAALARYRGGQAGVMYAEAFETVFRLADGTDLVNGKL